MAGEAAAAAADGGAEAGFGRGGGAIAEGGTAGEEQPPREDVEGIPDLVAAAEGEGGEGRSGQRRRALTRLPRGRPACSLCVLSFFDKVKLYFSNNGKIVYNKVRNKVWESTFPKV